VGVAVQYEHAVLTQRQESILALTHSQKFASALAKSPLTFTASSKLVFLHHRLCSPSHGRSQIHYVSTARLTW
jgi:hypothetical protein